MPTPRDDESKDDWMERCMESEESKDTFPDVEQRRAFCLNTWEEKAQKAVKVRITRESDAK